MQRRQSKGSALVSAAVLTGLAGLATASEFEAGSEQMRSIPVERVRPIRPVAPSASIEVERRRPVRVADLLLPAAIGFVETPIVPEPTEPQPTNPIPFDRSALVPTGSRWAEDRQPQFAQQQRSSIWADLVPTPVAGTAATTARTASPAESTTLTASSSSFAAMEAQAIAEAAAAEPTTPPATQQITQQITQQAVEPTAEPIAAAATDEPVTPAAAAESTPEGWPTISDALMAQAQASQPAQEAWSDVHSDNAVPTTTAETVVATPAATTNEIATASTWETVTDAHTQSYAETTGQGHQAAPANLASLFPAPEGWHEPIRKPLSAHGWDLVATPLPTATANRTTPAAPADAPPMNTMSTGTNPGFDTPAIESQHEQPAEPAATLSVREPAPWESELSAESAIVSELSRKSITNAQYEAARARLAQRPSARADDSALIAGDALGASMARTAGYID